MSGQLERFGIAWHGPVDPIAERMDDGYWTQWHIAQSRINELEAAAAIAKAEGPQ